MQVWWEPLPLSTSNDGEIRFTFRDADANWNPEPFKWAGTNPLKMINVIEQNNEADIDFRLDLERRPANYHVVNNQIELK